MLQTSLQIGSKMLVGFHKKTNTSCVIRKNLSLMPVPRCQALLFEMRMKVLTQNHLNQSTGRQLAQESYAVMVLFHSPRSIFSFCLFYKRLSFPHVSVRVSIAVKRDHDHDNSYKGKHSIGWLTFSEIQFIFNMVRHGSVQVDMVLEKQLRIFHLVQAKEVFLASGRNLEHIRDLKVSLHGDALPPRPHTYSNKATSLNSATHFGGHFFFKPPQPTCQYALVLYTLLIGNVFQSCKFLVYASLIN